MSSAETFKLNYKASQRVIEEEELQNNNFEE